MAYCGKCGSRIPEGNLFCGKCGTPVSDEPNAESIGTNETAAETVPEMSDVTTAGESIAEPETEPVKKKGAKKGVLIVLIILLVTGCGGAAFYFTRPEYKYGKAQQAFETGDYEKAQTVFASLGDYSDAASKAAAAGKAIHYAKGKELSESGDYEAAIGELKEAGDYDDSARLLKETYYENGLRLQAEQKYSEAIDSLELSEGYKGSAQVIRELANILIENGDYKKGLSAYVNLRGSQEPYAQYAQGMLHMAEQKYDLAADCFAGAPDVLDAEDKYKEAAYASASDKFAKGEYTVAMGSYSRLSGYKDAAEMVPVCELLLAKESFEKGNLNDAKNRLETLEEGFKYGDADRDELLSILKDNQKWVDLCGVWSSTGGKIKTEERLSYYYYNWSKNVENGDYSVQVRCILLGDGKATVKISGSYFVFTNYSAIKELLTYETKELDLNEAAQLPGTIDKKETANYTVSLKKDGIELNYSKTETPSVYGKDTYSTNISYKNKISDF